MIGNWSLIVSFVFLIVFCHPLDIKCQKIIFKAAILDANQCNFINETRNISDSTIITCETVLINNYKNYADGLLKFNGYSVFIGPHFDLMALISQTLNIPYFVTANVPMLPFDTMLQVAPSGGDIAKFTELFINSYYNVARSLTWTFDLLGVKSTDVKSFKHYFNNFFLNNELLLTENPTNNVTISGELDQWMKGKVINADLYVYIFATDGHIDYPLFQKMELLSALDGLDSILPFVNGFSNIRYLIRSKTRSILIFYNNKTYASESQPQFPNLCAKSAYDHVELSLRGLAAKSEYNRSEIMTQILETESTDLSFYPNKMRKCLRASVYIIDNNKTANVGVFDAVLNNNIEKAYSKLFEFCKNGTEYKLAIQYPISAKKQKVRVVAFKLSPFVNKANDTGRKFGWAHNILETILEGKGNFEIEWIFIEETQSEIQNKSWNALVEFLKLQKADIAAVPMVITESRKQQVLFTNPYKTTAFAVMQNRESTDNVPIVYRPFSLLLWIFLAGIILLLSFFFWLLELFTATCVPAKGNNSLSDALFTLVGSLFFGKPPVKPGLLVMRFIFLIVNLMAIMLITYYLAALHAQLANPVDFEVPIKNISTLVSDPNARYFFLENSEFKTFVEDTGKSNSGNDAVVLYNRAIQEWPDKAKVNTMQEVIDRFNSSSTTEYFIDQVDVINRFTYSTCLYRMTTANVYNIPLGFAMNKNWNYATTFSEELFNLNEIGTLQKLVISNEEVNIPCKEETGPLSLLKFAGTFYLGALGIVLAVLVIILEMIFRQLKLCHQRRRNLGSVEFGKTYKCKVTSVDNHGVWAKVTTGMDAMFFPIKTLLVDKKSDVKSTPIDMGIVVGSTINMKYMGNDPKKGSKVFHRMID